MLLPEFTYGTYKEVKNNSMKIMRRLRRGEAWEEIFSTTPMLDVNNYQNWIVVDGPCPIINEYGAKNFHVYVLHDVVNYYWTSQLDKSQEQDEIEYKIFNNSLEEAWCVLGLISIKNQSWMSFSSRGYYDQLANLKYRPLIRACLKYWPTLSDIGNRYSIALPEGSTLWKWPLGIKHILLRMNVPLKVIQQPLPSDRGLDIINDWIEW
jgi:hypothetical protein